MKWEGGPKVHLVKGDPGGLTKWGVALRFHPELGEKGIRDLTEEAAKNIALKDYWIPAGCDSLPKPLDVAVMDCAYNLGLDDVQILLPNTVKITEHSRNLFMALGAPYGAHDLFDQARPYLGAIIYTAGRIEKHEIVGLRKPHLKEGWKNRCYDFLKTFL
jgi:hypothetical protein